MARLILRDLSTNEEYEVPPEGILIGRVGGDADIQVEGDNTISRKQARVLVSNGAWVMETLYVPKGSAPVKPMKLSEGSTFPIGQAAEFEVVELEQPAGAPAKKPNPPSNAKTQASTGGPPKRTQSIAEQDGGDGGGEEEAAGGIGALFVGVPKGLAYYLVNVPKMLFNPMGTVRTTIEELPNEPLGRTGLIGYALPALLATSLLGAWAAGIAALIGPAHSFQLMLFLPIVPAISAVIGAVVTGFIFHPVLSWVITKLKGESDARSRSNYFLQTMTLSILLAVPNALGVILAALPVPFISLLGPLLSVAASLVSLYVTIKWFEFFKVVKWVKTVLLILGALSVLGAAAGLVTGTLAQIRALGAPKAPTMADAPAVDDAPADDGDEKPDDEKPTPKKPVAKADDAKPAPEKNDPPPEKPEPVAKNDEKPTNTPPPPVEKTPVDTSVPATGDYAVFARHRDAVEKTFENNPVLLQKNKDLQKLYGEYLDTVYELDKSYAKEISKNPERRRLYERLKEAELSQKTGKTIETLSSKLGIR